jgi:hypothetical protein
MGPTGKVSLCLRAPATPIEFIKPTEHKQPKRISTNVGYNLYILDLFHGQNCWFQQYFAFNNFIHEAVRLGL